MGLRLPALSSARDGKLEDRATGAAAPRGTAKAKPGRTPYLAASFFAWLALIADLSGS